MLYLFVRSRSYDRWLIYYTYGKGDSDLQPKNSLFAWSLLIIQTSGEVLEWEVNLEQ